MKVIGYICVFCALCYCLHGVVCVAKQYNIELAMFAGALIPITMAIVAGINGDLE